MLATVAHQLDIMYKIKYMDAKKKIATALVPKLYIYVDYNT